MSGRMDRRKFVQATVAGATISVSAPISSQAAPLTMRFAHFAAEDHPANIAAKQFASNVEKRTNGAIKVNIFPNNALSGPPEQAQRDDLSNCTRRYGRCGRRSGVRACSCGSFGAVAGGVVGGVFGKGSPDQPRRMLGRQLLSTPLLASSSVIWSLKRNGLAFL